MDYVPSEGDPAGQEKNFKKFCMKWFASLKST